MVRSGIDIVEIHRVANAITKHGDRFLQRVFTPGEISYCESRKKNKYQHYAARFAAKEAVFKVIDQNMPARNTVSWCDIEVYNDPSGKPGIQLSAQGLKVLEKSGGSLLHLSLSHSDEYAIAQVLLESIDQAVKQQGGCTS